MQTYESEAYMKRKAILDNVYYEIGQQQYDFELCILSNKFASKWKSYLSAQADEDFIQCVNNRTILPCEVVLDIEEPIRFQDIMSQVEKEFNCYMAYFTGSKGYHIHLYFDRKITPEEKLFIIKYYGCDEAKATERCMIALENCPHWKTGGIKTLVRCKPGLNLLGR